MTHLLDELVDTYEPTPEDRLHRRMAELERRIVQLEQTVELLAQVNPDILLPEACRKRECSYFRAYLPYGNGAEKDMPHAEFHQAEREHLNHLANCHHKWENGPCHSCQYHEKRTRA